MENPLSMKISQLNKELSTRDQRDAWLMSVITLGELLKPGAPTLNVMALDALMDLYSEFLDEVGPERFVAAYKLVLGSSKFRPDISELRTAAGAELHFPIEQEAKDELAKLIPLLRHHGRKLTNPGNPPREPPERFADIVMDTLFDMGFGNVLAGLEAVWAHPALDKVRPGDELDGMESFRAVAGEKIERRWVEFYTRRKAEGFKREAA